MKTLAITNAFYVVYIKKAFLSIFVIEFLCLCISPQLGKALTKTQWKRTLMMDSSGRQVQGSIVAIYFLHVLYSIIQGLPVKL